MAQFKIKKAEDGHGPNRWYYVVRKPDGLARGTIYTKQGDDLTTAEALLLREQCASAGYDVRKVQP